METKKEWKRPMLKVVARAHSEERVLVSCKNETEAGYNNVFNSSCHVMGGGICQDCAYHTLS